MAYGDDVKFEGDQSPMGAGIGIVAVENKMAAWLIRKGIAKTQTQAQYMLLGAVGAAILVTVIAWWLPHRSAAPAVTQQEIDAMNSAARR